MSINKPFNFKLKYTAKNCIFHPCENMFATADIVGKVRLYRYKNNETVKLNQLFKVSEEFIQDICFNSDGNKIYVASENNSISTINVDGNTITSFETNTEKFPPKNILFLKENAIASSHEDGTINIWDLRSNKVTAKLKFEANCVLMNVGIDKNILVCAENPGFISSFSLKNYKLIQKSEFKNQEISAISLFDNDTKFLVSMLTEQDSDINVFTVGKWCDPSDHVYLGIQGIEHMIGLPNRQLVVLDNTGFLGLYNIFPSFLIGYYSEASTNYYHSMKISYDDKILMGLNDEEIQFWNIEKDLTLINGQQNTLSKKLKVKNLVRKSKATNFYQDL